MSVRHHLPVLWTIPVIVAAGCAKTPPAVAPEPARPANPAAAHVTLAAMSDANPDAAGRPSPVVVRVYQLKGDAAFAGAEFFGLFDDEQQALGAEFLSRSEFVLAPSELRAVDVKLAADARFVGVAAAFRDIRNAEWHVLVPAWREGLKHMTVAVERARVVLSVSNPSETH
jgi:type VI secretion system protein VasD